MQYLNCKYFDKSARIMLKKQPYDKKSKKMRFSYGY